jgi:acetolactate synthase-1/2/3 large subunit
MTSAAEQLVAVLVAHGIDRVFCVPGESYLHVLDALRDSPIDTVVARQEGGAAMMAEADGKMTGRAGVCFVTRGPGATNASSGVHVAEQDSTPLVLFVGQVATGMLGRGAFQEVDYSSFYGGIAKAVMQLGPGDDAADMTRRALRIAQSGRPGPVVVALPEDLQGSTNVPQQAADDPEPITGSGLADEFADGVAADGVADGIAADIAAKSEELHKMLLAAKRPIAIAGGSGWSAAGVAQLQSFAEQWRLPVAVSFRRQQLFDHEHRNYAGDCGIGLNPQLRQRIEQADLVLLLGTRFSEIPSQGYTLLEDPIDTQKLVHVHVTQVDRFAHANLSIATHPQTLLQALDAPRTLDAPRALDPPRALLSPERGEQVVDARAQYESWSGQPARIPGDLQMGEVIQHLRRVLPDDAIVSNGAGNYASWVHRYFRFRGYGTQLAPTSGSMGYGVPAAVAAKIRFPQRAVVCFAGDGCFQMTGQEFATAVQCKANIVVIVVDNGMYGTIRMHQERRFPARVHATDLVNPDFAALARAYGGFGIKVVSTEEFPHAWEAAHQAGVPALIHMVLDPQAITPDTTLAALRDA